jgi:putative CocE/NonD family hydrolase
MVDHLPLRTADRTAAGRTLDVWQEALNHPSYDNWWRSRSTLERIASIHVPVFIVGGWYDNYVESDLDAFSKLRQHSSAHRIIVGPWGHNMTEPFRSGITFGRHAAAPVRKYQLEWFEHWLRGPQPAPDFAQAPVRIFVMGANRWREENEWPLVRTRLTPMYLSSQRGANTLNGDGLLILHPEHADVDRFTYDPRYPVPTAGGAVCCNSKIFAAGPMDQRRTEMRDDVLVYTSQPLKQDIEVTGSVRVVLFIASTAPDTDFTAKLVDVHPDGHARNLCDGILRLRYRDGLSSPKLAKPGQRYRIEIPAGVTSNVFFAGHRIRLEVSSSNFPRFDRNPNTGRPIADEREFRVARQAIFHGRETPSHVLLPVIPAAAVVQSGNRR